LSILPLYDSTSTLQEDFSCPVSNGGFSTPMVWYGMVNVDLYSAIITKVSNALNVYTSHVINLPYNFSVGLLISQHVHATLQLYLVLCAHNTYTGRRGFLTLRGIPNILLQRKVFPALFRRQNFI